MTKDLPRFILIGLIGALLIVLLKQWVSYSAAYDQKIAERQRPEPLPDIGLPETLNNTESAVPTDIAPVKHNATTVLTQDFPSAEPLDSPALENNGTTNGQRIIRVKTDTLIVDIDRRGGDIVSVKLRQHLQTIDAKDPFVLLERNTQRTYIAQSGLIGPNGTDSRSGRAVFTSAYSSYTMNNEPALNVDLVYHGSTGIVLTKRFHFRANDHLIDVSYIIDNHSSEQWQATFYSQINRDSSEDPGANDIGFGVRSYLGAATTNEESPYEKISFDDIEETPYRHQQTGGWVAMLQHYFVSAWIPSDKQQHSYFTKKSKSGLNIIGFTSAPTVVEPGESASVGAHFYAGPKNQYRLKEIAPHLDLTVDYGWLWWISQPLYTLLYFFATGDFHAFDKVFSVGFGVGNWGVAIILLTVVIKLAFFRLSAASYRSMANMRRVQPKMLAIRERHGDDKQAQSKAMMELYQKEKINPLGGCLPILIQMPVFIALYWALIESVELRHAPFFLWINDLSVMDPWFVLPVIMGATMWMQQRLNPAPPDPMQAKVMQWMPIVFTFFFLWFPAGLVVYWISNNVLSIAQQWVITRQIEKADAN